MIVWSGKEGCAPPITALGYTCTSSN